MHERLKCKVQNHKTPRRKHKHNTLWHKVYQYCFGSVSKGKETSKNSQSVSQSVQSYPTLCDPMNRSTPGLPVHHQLPEFTQTHVHVELFQILKDDAVKVLHSICQQIWKTQQWPQNWKRSVFIPIPKKGKNKQMGPNYN